MTERSYFRNGDGIRGMACLIVLLGHSMSFFHPRLTPTFAGVGKIGVWLFFVLSAFLLTNQLIRRGINSAVLKHYAISRFIRIIPLYFIACVAYFALGSAGIDTSADLQQAALMQYGYAHLWTIPVECKFYVVLPAIVAVALWTQQRLHHRFGFCLTLTLAVAIAIIFPFYMISSNSIELWPYIPAFLCGSLAALWKSARMSMPSDRNRWLFNLSMLVVTIASTNPIRSIIFPHTSVNFLMDKFIFFGALFSIFLVMNINAKGVINKLYGNKPMVLLGKWSYPIYLFHWFIFSKLSKPHLESWSWHFIAIFVAIALGGLVHYMIERPILSLRHRIPSRVSASLADAPVENLNVIATNARKPASVGGSFGGN
ncbi:MAG TPA: acyltransferase [Rhodanobacter sp.]|jgi:peptidoglycan/LPS O-acetylase OafA/YrhL|nr:acyltransferase [Rhodanobacter sp.]